VEMIGRQRGAIDKAETARNSSRRCEDRACLPAVHVAHSLEEALQVRPHRFPAVIRPSFTLGGRARIAYNREEFVAICERGWKPPPRTSC